MKLESRRSHAIPGLFLNKGPWVNLGMIRLLSELTQVHRASISLVKVDLECVKNDISADHSRTVGHGFENVLIRPSQIP